MYPLPPKRKPITKRLWLLAGGALLLLAVIIIAPLQVIAVACLAQCGMGAYMVYRLKGVDLYMLYVDWFTHAKQRIADERPYGH